MQPWSNPNSVSDEHTAAPIPRLVDGAELTQKIVESHDLTTLMITAWYEPWIEYINRLIMLYQGKIVVDVKGEEEERPNGWRFNAPSSNKQWWNPVSDELVLDKIKGVFTKLPLFLYSP